MKKIWDLKRSDEMSWYCVELSSGDGDEYPGCRLVIRGFGWRLKISLPQIIKPHGRIVYPQWDAATVARLGRDFYIDYTERVYGISVSNGSFLNVHFGRASDDSRTEQRWSYFLPWMEWRFVRFSIYDLQGAHVWTQLERRGRGFEEQRQAEAAAPVARFEFDDFDGERITVKTQIHEREWRRGEGWFKWLSWFYAPKIDRTLNLEFSKETGPKKGSWKGGTLGHGISLKEGDLHESGFRRYCIEHGMKFIGPLA